MNTQVRHLHTVIHLLLHTPHRLTLLHLPSPLPSSPHGSLPLSLQNTRFLLHQPLVPLRRPPQPLTPLTVLLQWPLPLILSPSSQLPHLTPFEPLPGCRTDASFTHIVGIISTRSRSLRRLLQSGDPQRAGPGGWPFSFLSHWSQGPLSLPLRLPGPLSLP